MDIRIRAAAASDIGRVRSTNEDAFGFDLDQGLFVVCDGVGGNRAGEVASRAAVDCILSRFRNASDLREGGAELHRVVQAANRSVFQAARVDAVYHGMATTVVAAHFDGMRMWIAHVGDSRAYLLRRGNLHRLTDDHSQLAQRLREDHRHLPAHEASRLDGVLTQAIGASDFIVPTVTVVQVQLGDQFLLATDGLTKALNREDMVSLLLAAADPEQACQQLLAAAHYAGGLDNATCILVEID